MNSYSMSQCPTCGSHKLIKENGNFICSHCGNIYYNSHINFEFYSLLDMALAQRQTAKFDDAFETYNMLVNKFNNEDLSDVYFGMFLCEYSVIFENNLEGETFPSFYAMRKTSCFNNYYYKKAIDFALKNNSKKANTFQELADKIEYARKTYLAIEKNNRPYDIFICYKKTGNDGNPTKEFEKAQHIYKTLKNLGFKVFFADETINKQAVREWEPNIYYALYTAKAMLVMCSENEYLNSAWVQNEWKRFISIKTNDINRAPVIPIVCDDFKAGELPNMLAKYQAIQYDNNIEQNIKDALLALTTKVNNQKEFLFKYKKPISKKLIASLVSVGTAIALALTAVMCYFYIPRIKFNKDINSYNVSGYFGNIVNLNIPDYYKKLPVKAINNSAFENNKSIISIKIGNNVQTIGRRAFSGMTKLKEVEISNSVSFIDEYAFYGCDNLITLTLSNKLSNISSGMFASCENLLSITIPKSIKNISHAAFLNCNSLSIINYEGTQAEWAKVIKGINNGNLTSAYVAYQYEIIDGPVGQLIFVSPTINYTIGKGYKDNELQYNSTLKQWEIHKGVDFLTNTNQPVYAVQDGVVNSIISDHLGTYFSITHSQGFVSFYYSVTNINVVEGQRVTRGQEIAQTGTYQIELDEGIHLHFELMKDGIKVNPLEYINL